MTAVTATGQVSAGASAEALANTGGVTALPVGSLMAVEVVAPPSELKVPEAPERAAPTVQVTRAPGIGDVRVAVRQSSTTPSGEGNRDVTLVSWPVPVMDHLRSGHVPAAATTLTVTGAQVFVPSTQATAVVVPGAFPVMVAGAVPAVVVGSRLGVTVAVPGAALTHETGIPGGAFCPEQVRVAVSGAVPPTAIVTVPGVTVIAGVAHPTTVGVMARG